MLNVSQRFVAFRGEAVKLTRTEADLMHPLVACMGTIVPIDRLFSVGWDHREDCPGPCALQVHIYNLRRKIKGLGLGIKNVWAEGYILYDDARATDA